MTTLSNAALPRSGSCEGKASLNQLLITIHKRGEYLTVWHRHYNNIEKLFLFPVRNTAFLRKCVASIFGFGIDFFLKSQYAILPPSFHRFRTSTNESASMSWSRWSGVRYREFMIHGNGNYAMAVSERYQNVRTTTHCKEKIAFRTQHRLR